MNRNFSDLMFMIWPEYTAVILRRYTHTVYKIPLLDEKLGRIEAIMHHTDCLAVGSLIQYSIKRQSGNMYFIEQWQLEDVPFALAQTDLLFLHHVLELCYYFIPIGSGVQGVFQFIRLLYHSAFAACGRVGKKLLLVKLLMTIGLYPEVALADMHYIQQLYMLSVDMKLDEAIDLAGEKKLDAWLLACIMQHPHHELFKTINFLIHDSVDRPI